MGFQKQAIDTSMSTLITTLTIFSALLFVAAGALLSMRRGSVGDGRVLGAGLACCVLLFAANAWAAQAPPLGNMRHVLCALPLLLAPVWGYLRRSGVQADAGIAGVAAVALIGALCMPLQAGWRQAPALQSAWFVPHVTSYMAAYAMLTLSALYAAGARGDRQLPRLEAAHSLARLAFPFLTFGLCSGALWADAAWGRYWAWDIKEVWSLITWLIYLIYFHAPMSSAAKQRALLLLGFAAVLVTFLIVNMAPLATNSLHTYAQ